MSRDKVLIVEDEKLVARDIALALEEADYEIVGMLSYGHEVIDRVAKLQPDLVLLDINILGSIDGVQVAEYLHRYWQTAVVFLTANTDEETFARAKRTISYGFLMKPYHTRQLLTTVETAIETHRYNQAQLSNLRRNITTALPHELNTVLNNILGLSEIITMEFDSLSDQEVFEFVSDIKFSAKRLHFFTKRYLFFTQLELLLANPDRLAQMTKMEPVICSSCVIDQIVNDMNKKFGRDFALELCNTNFSFPMEFFNSLLKELIDNSLRYSIPKTPIIIKTIVEGNYYIITIRNSAEKFELDSISDSGAYVKSGSIFHDRQGSGLGLGIVHRILRLVEGTIAFNYSDCILDTQVKLPIDSCVL